MKKHFSLTNHHNTTSTTWGVSFSCVHNVMDTMMMVSIIILCLLCLRGMAVILAAILAAVILEEKVKMPKARAC